MNDNELVLLDVDGGVATITLNRSRAQNAFDGALARRLSEIVRRVMKNDTVRVVVLRGNGPAFCIGADLATFFRHRGDPSPMVREILGDLNEVSLALREGGRLVISSIHGRTVGIGLSLAIQADFCIAADTTTLTPAYALLGLPPDGGATRAAAERIGIRRAIQLYLGEQTLDADRGLELGLIDRLVPAAELEQATRELSNRLAQNSADAILHTKALLRQSMSTPHAVQLFAEMEAIIDCMGTEFYRTELRKRIQTILQS
ncbi:enoyl-CoA hydratase/isomerase family protein [Bradyrhizobium sp. HKCCYLS2038]|uniref:enoyl-CoA hydratase/isomerase family protein n=1 Tax=unclassified Bradyrhizobium TaxID=2631580 RepID=UPI003EC06546